MLELQQEYRSLFYNKFIQFSFLKTNLYMNIINIFLKTLRLENMIKVPFVLHGFTI